MFYSVSWALKGSDKLKQRWMGLWENVSATQCGGKKENLFECNEHQRLKVHNIIKWERSVSESALLLFRCAGRQLRLCEVLWINVLYGKRPVASPSSHSCWSLQTAGLAFYQHHALAAFMWIIEFSSLFSFFLRVRTSQESWLSKGECRMWPPVWLRSSFFKYRRGGETRKVSV